MSLLIERVVEEIRLSIQNQDVDALEELLSFVPKENLLGFLPEEEWERYENEYCCDNCGGGFIREEMAFDVNGNDLCKGCHSSIIHSNYMKYGR
jgi:hypothetical protein